MGDDPYDNLRHYPYSMAGEQDRQGVGKNCIKEGCSVPRMRVPLPRYGRFPLQVLRPHHISGE